MHGGSDFNYAYRSEDTSIGPCEFAVSPWISGFQNSMTAEDGVGHEARKSNCAACVGKGTELQLVCINFLCRQLQEQERLPLRRETSERQCQHRYDNGYHVSNHHEKGLAEMLR